MTPPKKLPSKTIDSAAVRELADLLNDTGLTEIEYETEEHRIRVAKTAAVAVSAPVAAPAPVAAAPVITISPTAPASQGSPVKSPLVGTAYLCPQPGAAPYVKVGDVVLAGQTLMIVEAMKVMNPIKAHQGGKIAAIHVSDMTPVEFDEILMEIA